MWTRLRTFKDLAAKLGNKPAISNVNPSSLQLGGSLSDLVKLGESVSSDVHFYDLMLEFCEKLFDNELEIHVFEDRLRAMFGMNVSVLMNSWGSMLMRLVT